MRRQLKMIVQNKTLFEKYKFEQYNGVLEPGCEIFF